MLQASLTTDPPAAQAGPEMPANACLALVQQVAILGRQLRRAHACSVADLGLNDTQLLLLWVCADAGTRGIPQNRLASLLGLSTAQVSGLVDRLSQRELIAECANSGDRRKRLWSLTDAGRAQLDRVLRRLDPLATKLQARFGEAHLLELIRWLDGAGQVVDELMGDTRSLATLRLFPAAPPPCDAATCRGQEGV
jgi:DNA-binding MarR family transcriptional regulator